MEKNIKKAFELAEQEVQDKNIQNLKEIVKKLLEKKKKKEEDKREIENEISTIKNTLDNFKSGRLDKVKEMLDTDPKAKEVAPLNIIVIQNDNYIKYPTKPWYWNYEVNWNNGNWSSGSSLVGYNGSTTTNLVYTASGQDFQTFTTGTYNINSGIINL